jgi:hypothetical protein|tara:strand:+ start:1230 stop:3125 length:1896 start_codon:yes stop_codon:yes gene_type:complete
MPLQKLQFKPGINRETTSYTNEGGWFDCEKIRFRSGVPEKIGGWTKKSSNTFLGTCRSLHSWVDLAGTLRTGVGTHLKYYIDEGGSYHDVTPLRVTTSAGDVTFSATNGSSTITATDSSHGAVAGDFVTISGAATLGGLVTADVLNQEYQIVTVPTANTFTFTAKDTDGDTVTANGSDSGNGGGSVVGAYQINVGLDSTVLGTGWGAGTWSRGTWDSAASLTDIANILRLWTHDNFGEDLIINVRDGGVYYWDTSAYSNAFNRAIALSAVSDADSAPTVAKQILVSDRDRHVIAFGCDPEDDVGTQDPLLIRFSHQETAITWNSTATNTAGSLRLGSGSEIVTAVETRQQVLVFTDVSLHAMQFLGPPFTYGINLISENITIMGPLAAKGVDDYVFWMGLEDFYVFDGRIQKLPCTVKAYVFNDFNLFQKEKVFAALNSSFNEVWWFYPSSDSDTVDRYVVYNYLERAWYYGTMARTAWMDKGINNNPIAAGADNYLYNHENGLDDGSTSPASAITSYVESSQLDIGDGDKYVFIRRLIPDVTFDGSDSDAPSASFTLKTRNFPGGAYDNSDASTVTQSAAATTTTVEKFTNQVHVRLRGRSFALRVGSDGAEVQWRLGSPRVDIRPDGRR